MDQLTELRPPDFTDVTKWWIFSNKSLLVCLGGGVIAYLLFKITAMIIWFFQSGMVLTSVDWIFSAITESLF